MQADIASQVRNNPLFLELITKRNRFSWTLTIIMLVVYYGFILLVAFAKPLTFTNGATHSSFTYQGGSRFRAENGCECHIRCWQELDFTVA